MLEAFSLLILVALPAPLWADDGLTITGSVRLRHEIIDGQARTGFNDSDNLLSIRSIVGAEYRAGGFRIGGELYDSRVYGGDAGTPVSTSEVNAAELVRAYVGYETADPFGDGTRLALQAGRFTLNLGSRRLIAADDYRNTTNGYTGIRADLGLGGGTTVTLIYTLPQVRRPYDRASLDDNRVKFDRESFDLVPWGGLLTKNLARRATLSSFPIFISASATRRRGRHATARWRRSDCASTATPNPAASTSKAKPSTSPARSAAGWLRPRRRSTYRAGSRISRSDTAFAIAGRRDFRSSSTMRAAMAAGANSAASIHSLACAAANLRPPGSIIPSAAPT